MNLLDKIKTLSKKEKESENKSNMTLDEPAEYVLGTIYKDAINDLIDDALKICEKGKWTTARGNQDYQDNYFN